MAKKHILLITGSLRKESLNRQLAVRIAELVGERADVSFLEYADMPFMNQDMEFPVPEAVARVRKQVMAADGIWIVTPEYNRSFSGVLKNLLDWLSRAMEEEKPNGESAVFEKPVTFSGAGGNNATAGARSQLKALLEFMRMKVMSEPSTGIALSGEAFMTNRLSLSEKDEGALREQADAFLAFLEE